jgi:hypothetical protein
VSSRTATRLIPAGIAAGALLGALLLIVAEFTTLFQLRSSVGGGTVRSVGTGSHHSYALVPVAVLAVVLGIAVYRTGSRPALVAIGTLGVLALLISLLGDLPDAHRSGLIQIGPQHYAQAAADASAGLYMETLGAAVLLITSVSGLLLLGTPAPGGSASPGGTDGPGSRGMDSPASARTDNPNPARATTRPRLDG